MTPKNSTNDAAPPNVSEEMGGIISSNTNDNKRYRRRGFRKPATVTRPMIKQPKFEGKCEDLKGQIYDCSDARQSNMIVKTTKEIAEYVGQTFKKRK
jgi:hypothetical protein